MIRLGIQIHPKMTGANNEGTRDYSAEEKTFLDSVVIDLNASANLVLDEYKWCTRFRDMAKGTLFVFRKYHPSEGEFWKVTTPQDLLNDYRQYAGERIVINLGNESSANEKNTDDEFKIQANFYASCMKLFGEAGIPLAVPGWGTGHPDLTRLALLKPIWDAFKAYPLHYLSLHEYFSYRGLEVGNGRVGRHSAIAGWLNVHDYPVPNMLITEHGCDQIDNTGERGWKSGYDGDEEKYAAYLIEAQRTTYTAPYIKGVMIYCHGDSNSWPDFDISNAKQLYRRLITENRAVIELPPTPTPPPAPPPAPIPPPPPPTPRLDFPAAARITNINGAMQFRKGPGKLFETQGLLFNQQRMIVFQGTKIEADSYKWIYAQVEIEGKTLRGYFALLNGARLELTGDVPDIEASKPDEPSNIEKQLERAEDTIQTGWLLLTENIANLHKIEDEFRKYRAAKSEGELITERIET